MFQITGVYQTHILYQTLKDCVNIKILHHII